jgi:hypothetical protein
LRKVPPEINEFQYPMLGWQSFKNTLITQEKYFQLTFIEKPDTGILLMKDSSNLTDQRKSAKRLGGPKGGSSDSRLHQGQKKQETEL